MAEQFTAEVEVEAYGQSVSAQSIMGLMMLGAGKGASIETARHRGGCGGGAGRADGPGRGRVP